MDRQKQYGRQLQEIHSMMEMSSKFMSLSGWSGISAGMYALAGAYWAYKNVTFGSGGAAGEAQSKLLFPVALLVLGAALLTAVFFSYLSARKRGERIWNAPARRLLISMLIPLLAGGLVMLRLLSMGLWQLILPLSLIFYGLALLNASKFTVTEVRTLGLVQLVLGLSGLLVLQQGLLIWAMGFGVVHIVYGIYMFKRYKA